MLFGELHKCEDLVQSAVTHIHFNFRKVAKEEEFLDLPKEHLCDLLSSEQLRIDNEYQVGMNEAHQGGLLSRKLSYAARTLPL